MYELALFAGAGGGLLASQWLKGWRTVCYVEREPYAVEVLKARIADGMLDDAPIWSDVRSFTKRNNETRRFIRQLRRIRSELVVSGGFPCQPFSEAGKRQSNADYRNGWPDFFRIVREIRPAFVFIENVRGLLSAVDKAADESVRYFGTILRDLATCGYDARWRVLSAAELGAPHKRDRLFVLAYANGFRVKRRGVGKNGAKSFEWGNERERCENCVEGGGFAGAEIWGDEETDILRMVDGVGSKMDRIRAIGNGQVPDVAATAWDLLTR